jgi:polar amino acid transport system permease protein
LSVTEQQAESAGRPEEEIKAVPVRRPGRWAASAVVLVIVASIVRSVATNKNFEWGLVRQYLFDPRILHGIPVTIELTVVSMVIGIILGVILAVMRMSPNPLLSGSSWVYIWFFRGTPLVVQLIFWANIGALFPTISLGVPFGPAIVNEPANTLVPAFLAAVLGFGLNEGAYMAEIVRAGIISVPEGQSEAAGSLGMNRLQIMWRIVLPQSMRVIIPPTGNETISMLKNTSLAFVLGSVYDLTFEAQTIYNANFKVIPLLIVASIWYLVLTSILYVGQYFIERRYGRGFSRAQRVTMRERWLGFGFGRGGAAAQ